MKKLRNKLSSRRGETLVETLAAILIVTFASIILLSMIAAATKLNITAKQHDRAMAAELNVAEAQDSDYPNTKTKDTTEIKIYAPGSDAPQSIPVTEFNSGDGTLFSFAYRETT